MQPHAYKQSLRLWQVKTANTRQFDHFISEDPTETPQTLELKPCTCVITYPVLDQREEAQAIVAGDWPELPDREDPEPLETPPLGDLALDANLRFSWFKRCLGRPGKWEVKMLEALEVLEALPGDAGLKSKRVNWDEHGFGLFYFAIRALRKLVKPLDKVLPDIVNEYVFQINQAYWDLRSYFEEAMLDHLVPQHDTEAAERLTMRDLIPELKRIKKPLQIPFAFLHRIAQALRLVDDVNLPSSTPPEIRLGISQAQDDKAELLRQIEEIKEKIASGSV